MENTNVFNLISLQKWNEIIKMINKNDNFDINIRDNSSYYLINYAIMFNNFDLVQLLIKRNCKLDILDEDNRNILFLPIKFGYNSILELILKNNNIGVDIDEIKDNNGFNAIHYTIIFKNFDALKLFKKYNKNLNLEDKDGNLPIHLAIKENQIEMFNFLINEIEDKDFQNKFGESMFHMSCNYGIDIISNKLIEYKVNINLQDYENQVTPIMYLIILNNHKIINEVFSKINFNIQDFNGNNILHYCIIENNITFVNRILDENIDLDISNIYGKTFLHLLVENYDESFKKLNLEKIFNNTNINIQDNFGNSIFLLICKNNLLTTFYEFLKGKKINYLLKNKKNESAIDFISKNKIDYFYKLISTSYLEFIRKNNKDFNNEIYNICKKKLSRNEFNKLKLDVNFNEKINNNDVCNDLFFYLIKENKLTYPSTIKNYCIDLDKFNKDVEFITFTGSTIDILFGLIYLLKISNNITTSLSSNFYENKIIENYYINIKNKLLRKEDFINFEIIWDGLNLYFPNNLESILKQLNKDFLIIPLGIELENGSHSNMLIYDKKNNQLERFEPNGSMYPFKFNYYPIVLDQKISEYFNKFLKNLTYLSPNEYLPKIGFQILESMDKNKKIGDPGGFCAVWCIWYSSMRVKYSKLNNKILVKKLILKIKEQNIEFKILIRNFAKNIIEIRDKILISNHIDINKWLNSNYEKKIFNNIISDIRKLIN